MVIHINFILLIFMQDSGITLLHKKWGNNE